jgi:sialate O-acetylesterase
MMIRRIPRQLSLLILTLLLATRAYSADPQPSLHLPAIFSDNMVLQRNFATPIWGTASPNQAITLKIADQTKQTTADQSGKWMIKLDPIKEGGPYELSISGPSTITYKNVLFGDVWICSGQSNMEFQLKSARDAQPAIESSSNPNLRLFTVKKNPANQPISDVTGAWAESSAQTSPNFSAVGYFFGRELQKDLNIPIGLIHTSWGGTAIQLWQSKEAMEADPDMKKVFDGWQTRVDQYEAQLKKYQLDAAKAREEGKPVPTAPRGPGNGPATLYNGMIAPLVPYGVAGAIWYQGESNAGNARLYRKQMPAMINQWRKEFGREFPFYQVQLANFMKKESQPVDSDWAELREAQLQTAQTNPKTGVAVIIDIGESNDIHPKNKEDVGKRLALAALGTAYDKKIEYSGPIYDSMKVESNKIRLSFKHTGAGLMARSDERAAGGEKVKGFAIAGEDKKFVWAEAQIDGNSIVVSSPEVQTPVAVRYGWANNPDCNLYNKEGLPASPFRTDNWPKAAKP